jgi:PmbA protein
MTQSPQSVKEHFDLLEDIIRRAKAKGADNIEARITKSEGLSATVSNGDVTGLKSPNSASLSIAAHIGARSAVASIATLNPDHIEETLDAVILSAKLASEDPYKAVADPSEIVKTYPEMDLADPSAPTAEELISRAREADQAALASDHITLSNGATASWADNKAFIMISNGFQGHLHKTGFSITSGVIAEKDGEKRVGYEGSGALFQEDLVPASLVGEQAALNASNMLGAQQVQSQKVPVVFDRDVSGRILGAFLNAVSGPAVAKKQSFLGNQMGAQIFPSNITIIDDPFLERGLGSAPFDSEGMKRDRLTLVENGVIKNWMTDLASARELGVKPSGRGSGPTNLYIEAGSLSVEDLIDDIKQGLFVTSLMGGGANIMTNAYSSGASGFWIENGRIVFPVHELTIAGNLHDMFADMQVANDLAKKRSSISAPTMRFSPMTVGGR